MDSEDDGAMDNDYDLSLMTREWEKISQSRYKDGFIEGSTAGQNQSLQQAFNAGFTQGFLSNFVLSKIRGILSALLAYQISYEGHPITDATLIETHSLLEEIDSLEANAVAEEFVKLSLHQTSSSQHCTDDLLNSFTASTSLTPSQNCNEIIVSTPQTQDETVTQPKLNLDAVNGLTVKKVNEMLMQCPPILNSVNRCKSILRSLNWTDDMIDNLL